MRPLRLGRKGRRVCLCMGRGVANTADRPFSVIYWAGIIAVFVAVVGVVVTFVTQLLYCSRGSPPTILLRVSWRRSGQSVAVPYRVCMLCVCVCSPRGFASVPKACTHTDRARVYVLARYMRALYTRRQCDTTAGDTTIRTATHAISIGWASIGHTMARAQSHTHATATNDTNGMNAHV